VKETTSDRELFSSTLLFFEHSELSTRWQWYRLINRTNHSS